MGGKGELRADARFHAFTPTFLAPWLTDGNRMNKTG